MYSVHICEFTLLEKCPNMEKCGPEKTRLDLDFLTWLREGV